MRHEAVTLLAIWVSCGSAMAQPSAPTHEAARVLVVSWYTRTLPTTDVDILVAAGSPPQIPQEALSELNEQERAAIPLPRRNGSTLHGLVWYDSPSEFATAYMDPSSGAVSLPWDGMASQGLPAFPVGSVACGQMSDFAWSSESGNLLILRPKQLHPALASRLRDVEFMIAMDRSPEDAFTEFVSRIGAVDTIERSESDRGTVFTWRSVDQSVSIVLRVDRLNSRPEATNLYSWTMTAVDSTHHLATITAAEVQPATTIALDLPATPDDLPNVYQGMVSMSLVPGESLGDSESTRRFLDLFRRLVGAAVFVAVLCVLLARKDQS